MTRECQISRASMFYVTLYVLQADVFVWAEEQGGKSAPEVVAGVQHKLEKKETERHLDVMGAGINMLLVTADQEFKEAFHTAWEVCVSVCCRLSQVTCCQSMPALVTESMCRLLPAHLAACGYSSHCLCAVIQEDQQEVGMR